MPAAHDENNDRYPGDQPPQQQHQAMNQGERGGQGGDHECARDECGPAPDEHPVDQPHPRGERDDASQTQDAGDGLALDRIRTRAEGDTLAAEEGELGAGGEGRDRERDEGGEAAEPDRHEHSRGGDAAASRAHPAQNQVAGDRERGGDQQRTREGEVEVVVTRRGVERGDDQHRDGATHRDARQNARRRARTPHAQRGGGEGPEDECDPGERERADELATGFVDRDESARDRRDEPEQQRADHHQDAFGDPGAAALALIARDEQSVGEGREDSGHGGTVAAEGVVVERQDLGRHPETEDEHRRRHECVPGDRRHAQQGDAAPHDEERRTQGERRPPVQRLIARGDAEEVVLADRPGVQHHEQRAESGDALGGAGETASAQRRGDDDRGDGDGSHDEGARDDPVVDEGVDEPEHREGRQQRDADDDKRDLHARAARPCRGGWRRRGGCGGVLCGGCCCGHLRCRLRSGRRFGRRCRLGGSRGRGSSRGRGACGVATGGAHPFDESRALLEGGSGVLGGSRELVRERVVEVQPAPAAGERGERRQARGASPQVAQFLRPGAQLRLAQR